MKKMILLREIEDRMKVVAQFISNMRDFNIILNRVIRLYGLLILYRMIKVMMIVMKNICCMQGL